MKHETTTRLERQNEDFNRCRKAEKKRQGNVVYNGVVTRINKTKCMVYMEGSFTECSILPQMLKEYQYSLQKGFTKESLMAIGDRVLVENNIVKLIAPRTNSFARKATVQDFSHKTYRQILAANIDLVTVFMPCAHSDIEWGLIDSFMLSCCKNGIKSALVFNKTDLVEPQKLEEIKVKALEYNWNLEGLFFISVMNNQGTEELKNFLMDKKTFLVGISGAGKSTFLNYMKPDLNLQTGVVNEKTGRGNHTTAFSTLIPLSQDNYLIDSPGVQMFDQYGVVKSDLKDYLPQITQEACNCKFSNCTHIMEDNEVCSVKQAVQQGTISRLCYNRYVYLYKKLGD